MPKKLRLLVPLAILVVLFVSGCGSIANAVGYVPQADLDTANAKIAELEKSNADLTAKLETATSQLDTATKGLDLANTNLAKASSDLDGANLKLASWNKLICKHSWDEFLAVSGAYPFVGKLPSFPDAEYELFFTGWSTDPDAQLTTTILVDKEGSVWSMAIDAVDDCLIMNPVFFTPTK